MAKRRSNGTGNGSMGVSRTRPTPAKRGKNGKRGNPEPEPVEDVTFTVRALPLSAWLRIYHDEPMDHDSEAVEQDGRWKITVTDNRSANRMALGHYELPNNLSIILEHGEYLVCGKCFAEEFNRRADIEDAAAASLFEWTYSGHLVIDQEGGAL